VKYLVDNSVWQRISNTAVFEAVTALTMTGSIVVITPQMLEYGHSARNPRDYDALMQRLNAFELLVPDAECHALAMRIQSALWHNGKVRGAGAFDILIAAIALRHGAAVAHLDKNFQTIASIMPELQQLWIGPRGTLD